MYPNVREHLTGADLVGTIWMKYCAVATQSPGDHVTIPAPDEKHSSTYMHPILRSMMQERWSPRARFMFVFSNDLRRPSHGEQINRRQYQTMKKVRPNIWGDPKPF